MISWLIFIIVALFLTFLAKNNPNNSKNREYLILVLSLWLGWFVSFGGQAMQDQKSYSDLFQSAIDAPISGILDLFKLHINSLVGQRETYEIGYVFLNVIFAKLGFGYVGFIFIFSVVMNFLLIKFIFRYDNALMSVIILIGSYVYIQQANLIRQMMVVSMFVYSIKYIENRNLFKFSIFIFLGSMLHMSSLILFPIYFIAHKNFKKYIVLIIWLLSVFINKTSMEFDFLANLKILYYQDTMVKIGRAEELRFDWIENILFLACTIFYNYKKINLPQIRIAFNLFFIGVVLSNISSLSFNFYRISLYFIVFGIVVIPLIPEFIKINKLMCKLKLNLYLYYPVGIFIFLWFFKILWNRVTVESISLGTSFYSIYDFFNLN